MQGLYTVIGRGTPMEIAWWQMCVRAFIIFLFGVVLVRAAGQRAFGRQSALDIVLTVLLGSNLSRALTGGAPFLPTIAATAEMTLLYWIAIRIAYRSEWVGYLLKGSHTVLVRNGTPDRAAMRRVAVSHHDLFEAAHQAHVPDLDKVELALLERSGHITIVPRKD